MKEVFEHNKQIYVIHYNKIIHISDILNTPESYYFIVKYINDKTVVFDFKFKEFGIEQVGELFEFKYATNYFKNYGNNELDISNSIKCWRTASDKIVNEKEALEHNNKINQQNKKNNENINKLFFFVDNFRNHIISKITNKKIIKVINTINLKKNENSN